MAVFGSRTESIAAPRRARGITLLARGFTMLEVMIVVAIVAILAAIALPSYSDYVRRGKIIDATSKLSDARVHLEQWFQDRRTYVGACDVGTGVVNTVPATDDYFALSCPTLSATQYTVQANGIVGKGMDLFGPYQIDQSNAKSSVITQPGWSGNAGCWATRKDGSCG